MRGGRRAEQQQSPLAAKVKLLPHSLMAQKSAATLVAPSTTLTPFEAESNISPAQQQVGQSLFCLTAVISESLGLRMELRH